MKVDVRLTGDGFKVDDLKAYLDKIPNFEYKLELVQELGEPTKRGPNKGKPSEYGFCWINRITLKQLDQIGSIFKSYKIDDIAINIEEKKLKNQTCLYLDKDLINIASRIDADIEIVD